MEPLKKNVRNKIVLGWIKSLYCFFDEFQSLHLSLQFTVELEDCSLSLLHFFIQRLHLEFIISLDRKLTLFDATPFVPECIRSV